MCVAHPSHGARETQTERTRVGDARRKQLGDGAEEEEVEVGEGRCARRALGEPQCAATQDEVLELLEQLHMGRNRPRSVSEGGQGSAGVKRAARTVNCRIGFETRISAGPRPWKKAPGPSERRMSRMVCQMVRRFSTTFFAAAPLDVSDATVVRTVCRVCEGETKEGQGSARRCGDTDERQAHVDDPNRVGKDRRRAACSKLERQHVPWRTRLGAH